MSRIRTAVGNALLNFVVGYALGSLLKDRETGRKVGLVLAVVGGLVAFVVSGTFGEEDDDTFFGIDRVRTTEDEPTDEAAA